jgi:hypothetical protein
VSRLDRVGLRSPNATEFPCFLNSIHRGGNYFSHVATFLADARFIP